MVGNFLKLLGQLNYFRYRFKYLINYIVIGFFSILLELIIVKILISYSVPLIFSMVPGFLCGMLFAFFLNAKLNFKVPRSKNVRTFLFFFFISIGAFVLNILVMKLVDLQTSVSYNSLRFFSAGLIFLISYSLHRRYTFDFVKKVGVAVYLSKKENVREIYSKIKYYADFIHIDLVDESYGGSAEVELSLMNEINKTWFLKKMIHIMSKKPSKWINKLYKDVDVVIIHNDIDESIFEVIRLCRRYFKKVGISIRVDDSIGSVLKYLPYVDYVQVMGISELGKSGQGLDLRALEKVNKLNQIMKKYNFEIIFDGGVKRTNINKINAKYIVSGSGLLGSENPVESFMELKTSSRYHQVEDDLEKDVLEKVKFIVENLEFIESGSVMNFKIEENSDLKNIQIIIILDKIIKKKIIEVEKKFEDLKRDIESKYGIFAEKLFNLNVFDKDSYEKKCNENPFVCFEWQLKGYFFKKSLKEIFLVKIEMLDFLRLRENFEKRIDEDYIENLVKFFITNCLRIYYRSSKDWGDREMFQRYFYIFPKNKRFYNWFFKRLNKFDMNQIRKYLKLFLRDFEEQVRKMDKRIVF